MFKKVLVLLVALSAVLIAAVPHDNPQQKICARPPKDCKSQRVTRSCTNWHGCKWVSEKEDGKFCKRDASCANGKKTRVPTPTPVSGPTKKPTPRPTNPTLQPTRSPQGGCERPKVGCTKIKKGTSCQQWTGCFWGQKNGKGRNRCLKANCDPVPPPTPPCDDQPEGGCSTKKNKGPCKAFSCCSWKNGKKQCVLDPPVIPTMKPTKKPTAFPTERIECNELSSSKAACSTRPNQCRWCANCNKPSRCKPL